MPLLADAIGFGKPGGDFAIDFVHTRETEGVKMVTRREGFDAAKARVGQTARQNNVAVDPVFTNDERRKAHPHLKRDPRLFRQDRDRSVLLRDSQQPVENRAHGFRLTGEVRGERITTAGVGLIAIRELPSAIRTAPQGRQPFRGFHALVAAAAIKAGVMAQTAAIIDVGREREEREILPVHVVLKIEHAREAGAGDLRFRP